jgi:hypothetical protein
VPALRAKIPHAAINGNRRPPMAGPITRERFSCTDWRETAPGMSRFGTSTGRTAENTGALRALPMPTARTHRKTTVVDGC